MSLRFEKDLPYSLLLSFLGTMRGVREGSDSTLTLHLRAEPHFPWASVTCMGSAGRSNPSSSDFLEWGGVISPRVRILSLTRHWSRPGWPAGPPEAGECPPHSTLASSWHPPGQAPGVPQRPSDKVLGQALPVPWACSRLALGSASPWHSLWDFVYRLGTSVSRATFIGGGGGTGSSQSPGNLSSLRPWPCCPPGTFPRSDSCSDGALSHLPSLPGCKFKSSASSATYSCSATHLCIHPFI